MQNNLRDLLDELADDARPHEPAPDLWRRGWRRHRVRQATAVVATVVAVVGLASASVLRPEVDRTTPVVAPTTRLSIPDRIYDVPRWTPGTEEAGPPGPLAALLPGYDRPRGWGSSDAPVGISAVDGSYWFIDMPGSDPDGDAGPVLSPDGGSIAYEVHGEPASSLPDSDVVGVAVYDTVTGEVRRHEPETELGISVSSIDWSPDSRYIVLSYGQMTEPYVSQGSPPLVWDVATGRSHELDGGHIGSGWDPRGVVAVGYDDVVRTYDPASGRLVREVKLDPGINGATSPSARSVVVIGFGRVAWSGHQYSGTGDGETRLQVAGARAGTLFGRAVLPSDEHNVSSGLYGWVDEHTVLMSALTEAPMGGSNPVYRVNVETGTKTQAIRCRCTPQLATDLITRPFTPGVQPDSPRDPRPFVIGGGIAAALGGLTLVVLLIRSRRWS